MKLTLEQRKVAALYWTHILTGQVCPNALVASKKLMSPTSLDRESMIRPMFFKSLKAHSHWSHKFQSILESLLADADETLCINLEDSPLLNKAAENSGIPKEVFPVGTLNMTFDKDGHIIVEGKKINIDEFMGRSSQNMLYLSRL